MKEKPTPPTLMILARSRWYHERRRERFLLSRVASHVRADRSPPARSAEKRRSGLARGLLRPPLHPPGAGVSPPAPLIRVPRLRPGGGRDSRIRKGPLRPCGTLPGGTQNRARQQGLCPCVPLTRRVFKAAYRGLRTRTTTTMRRAVRAISLDPRQAATCDGCG